MVLCDVAVEPGVPWGGGKIANGLRWTKDEVLGFFRVG